MRCFKASDSREVIGCGHFRRMFQVEKSKSKSKSSLMSVAKVPMPAQDIMYLHLKPLTS